MPNLDFDFAFDTMYCLLTDCAEGEVMCDVSRCIPQSKICDGETDCDDHSDESNCVGKWKQSKRSSCCAS